MSVLPRSDSFLRGSGELWALLKTPLKPAQFSLCGTGGKATSHIWTWHQMLTTNSEQANSVTLQGIAGMDSERPLETLESSEVFLSHFLLVHLYLSFWNIKLLKADVCVVHFVGTYLCTEEEPRSMCWIELNLVNSLTIFSCHVKWTDWGKMVGERKNRREEIKPWRNTGREHAGTFAHMCLRTRNS